MLVSLIFVSVPLAFLVSSELELELNEVLAACCVQILIPSKAPATATEPSPSKSMDGKFCAVLVVVKYAKEVTRVEKTTDAP